MARHEPQHPRRRPDRSEHPKGVKPKDFTSASGSIGIKFAPKFEKKGTYGFVCTFHKSVMAMTVEVKK